MPLSSLFERFRRGANGAATGAAPGARAPSPSDVELLRTRARRRLIGMVVLVGAGVLGFPWLFETQPRSLAPDVRIVHSGQAASADAEATPRAASGRVAQVANIRPPLDAPAEHAEAASADEGRTEAVPSRREPAAPVPAPKADPKPDTRPAQAPKPAAKPAEKVAEKPADKKPEAKAEAKSDTRYVVQFGAFADANAARETRQKAERMGLKTYAQQVDTPQGKRIRVRLGPFTDKAEAEKALATLRKGGLNGNVLTL